MIQLTQVLPIQLKLNDKGKKIPIGGMNKSDRKDYIVGMQNFAIYMADYPEIVVLDLDTKDHPLLKYIDMTYTHETRKGWHCFFQNTFEITRKRQMQKDKFDLLAGNNWIFYDYNDPEVAFYKEYNQLPLAPMPSELYDMVKVRATETDGKIVEEFIPTPLIANLKSKKNNLWDSTKNKWIIDNSSDLAYAVMMTTIPYTDVPEHLVKILELIPEIDEKHSKPDYMERLIKNVKQDISKHKAISWRPLSDFRLCIYGEKKVYADIDNKVLQGFAHVDVITLPNTNIDLLQQFVATYTTVEFNPRLTSKFNHGVYNLFNGFIDISDMTEDIEYHDHEKYLDMILHAICDNDHSYYDYLLNYMAHLVQKPWEKPDVAIVLYGSKGTGKDTFHVLMGQMFQAGGYINITDQMLTGRFNKPLESCILGVAEELVFGGSHKEDSKLKRLITGKAHTIEGKGKEPIEVNNYLRLIVTSNHARPVRATDGERRYFALSPSEVYKDNHEFWKELYSNFNPKHLLYFLQHRDISGFNTRELPASRYLQDIINENKDPLTEAIELWWEEVANGDIMLPGHLYDTLVEDKKYVTKRQLTTKVFHICGKEHFRKAFSNEYKSHYVVENKIRQRGPTDD